MRFCSKIIFNYKRDEVVKHNTTWVKLEKWNKLFRVGQYVLYDLCT